MGGNTLCLVNTMVTIKITLLMGEKMTLGSEKKQSVSHNKAKKCPCNCQMDGSWVAKIEFLHQSLIENCEEY